MSSVDLQPDVPSNLRLSNRAAAIGAAVTAVILAAGVAIREASRGADGELPCDAVVMPGMPFDAAKYKACKAGEREKVQPSDDNAPVVPEPGLTNVSARISF